MAALTQPTNGTLSDVSHINQYAALYTGGLMYDVVHGYGAVGDGAADDTAALQAALDAVPAAGGEVFFPPGIYRTTSTLTVKTQTALRGVGSNDTGTVWTPSSIWGDFASPIITAADNSRNIFFDKLGFKGKNVSGSKGIYATNTQSWRIRDCFLTNFGDQAVHLPSGIRLTVNDVWIEGGCLVRTGRSDYVGAFEWGGTDGILVNVVSTTNSFAAEGPIGSGYIAGIVVSGGTNSMFGCVGQLSQTGIVVSTSAGLLNKLVDCRADQNLGNGFLVTGPHNNFDTCLSLRNGLYANNTYAGFLISGVNGIRNTFTTCRVEGIGVDANLPKYGFEDDSSQGSGDTGNQFVACRVGIVDVAYRTAPYFFGGDNVSVALLLTGRTAYTSGEWASTYEFRDGGLVMKSPDGTRYIAKIANGGTWVITAA
jgi:hypothetical protein